MQNFNMVTRNLLLQMPTLIEVRWIYFTTLKSWWTCVAYCHLCKRIRTVGEYLEPQRPTHPETDEHSVLSALQEAGCPHCGPSLIELGRIALNDPHTSGGSISPCFKDTV